MDDITTNSPQAVSSGKYNLRAATSLLVFLFFIAGQFSASFTTTVFKIVAQQINGNGNTEAIGSLVSNSTPEILFAAVIGGFIGLAFAIYVLDISVKDNSHFGAAWILGPSNAIFKSIFLGIAIAFLYLILAALIGVESTGGKGMLAEIATQPGAGQLYWIVIALFLAPLIEEPLFRGVLLGGINRSFGIWWAVLLTNLIFLAIHYSEAVHYWPSFIGLTLLCAATTKQRLATSTIGPAIAIHFGYNLFLVTVAVFYKAHNTATVLPV